MANHLEFTVDGILVRMDAQEIDAVGHQGVAAIVLLHGSGGNLDSWTSRLAPLVRSAGIALYVPHYFDRTATHRADLATISDGIHVPQWLGVVDEAVRFVAGRPGVNPQRIVLAGISLGVLFSASPSRPIFPPARIPPTITACGLW